MDIRRSALYRYVKAEESWRWHDSTRIASELEFFSQDGLDVIEQLMGYTTMPLEPSLRSLRASSAGQEFLRWCHQIDGGFIPRKETSLTVLDVVGALLGGFDKALSRGQLDTRRLSSAFSAFHGVTKNLPTHWARMDMVEYELALVSEARRRFPRAFGHGGQEGHLPELLFAAQLWQRLEWLASCRQQGAIVISVRATRPLPSDPLERFGLLHRLASNQPMLRHWPEFGRFLPNEYRGMMPVGEAFGRALKPVVLAADESLLQRLLDDVVRNRRYLLDHIAIIELDHPQLETLTLAPERRSEGSYSLGFLVHQRRGGSFIGETRIIAGTEARAYAPLVDTLPWENADVPESSATPAEVMRTLELLVVAAWRDLVVPGVRIEQYEQQTERKAKERQGLRQRARGDLTIIRYLPRRIVVRRREEEVARSLGRRRRPDHYAVGAYTRRLPRGQQRSALASEFAAEIGIPLQESQTVVRPHWRGGIGNHADEAIIRRWRSWSALDLLRTHD